MKAIVLSPGPSLASYVPQPAEMVVGINRAATAFPVTHWCCGDTPAVMNTAERVIGSPTLVTYNVTRDALRDHKFIWRGEIETWTNIAESSWLHTSVVNWPWCSFTAGIVFAAWKGCTQIDVYGATWAGTLDWDNFPAGKNRTDDRWREERSIFNALCVVLKDRGVTVNRVVPNEMV